MSEETIIDGIDVAGCPYRKKEVTFMNVIKCYNYGACEGVNCLYKQLKRLQAENERLTRENRYYKAELKLSCNELDKSNKWEIAERQKKNIYRTALKEIKKLINETCWDYTDISIIPVKDKMLEIINEVLKDEQ